MTLQSRPFPEGSPRPLATPDLPGFGKPLHVEGCELGTFLLAHANLFLGAFVLLREEGVTLQIT